MEMRFTGSGCIIRKAKLFSTGFLRLTNTGSQLGSSKPDDESVGIRDRELLTAKLARSQAE